MAIVAACGLLTNPVVAKLGTSAFAERAIAPGRSGRRRSCDDLLLPPRWLLQRGVLPDVAVYALLGMYLGCGGAGRP